ncbi:yciC, partial [Symbiodinium microadriaticum]
YNQANEALTAKIDAVAEAVSVGSTRVQAMQSVLHKMAAARPKAPPPAFPAPDIPTTETAGLPLTTPPAFTPSIGAAVQAAPGIPLGLPTGASLINLSPPPQQDTVTVWMEGRAFQIPTAMVRGVN